VLLHQGTNPTQHVCRADSTAQAANSSWDGQQLRRPEAVIMEFIPENDGAAGIHLKNAA
jgi:hypothetical protein